MKIVVGSVLYSALYGKTKPQGEKGITRYEPFCEQGCGWSMGKWSTGSYVKFEDHEAAISKLKIAMADMLSVFKNDEGQESIVTDERMEAWKKVMEEME